jgi:hypothetical protein
MFCGNSTCDNGNRIVNRIVRVNLGKDNKPPSLKNLKNGVSGTVYAMARNGTAITTGGSFTTLCGNEDCSLNQQVANRIGQWNGSDWSALENGVSGTVRAIAIGNDTLFVGGLFAQTCADIGCANGNLDVNNIARYQMPTSAPTATPTKTSTPTSTSTYTPTSTRTATTSPSPCAGKPTKPHLLRPGNGQRPAKRRVKLEWYSVSCATRYEVVVKGHSTSGDVIVHEVNVFTPQFTTPRLEGIQKSYFWRVRAWNASGASAWSDYWSFRIGW